MKTYCLFVRTVLFFSLLLSIATPVMGQKATAWLTPDPDAVTHIRLVSTFLHHLANGQEKAAHQLMADNFKCIGPDFQDQKDRNQTLNAIDYNQKIFTNQRYLFQDSSAVVCLYGEDKGIWVYHRGFLGGIDKRDRNRLLSMTFHHLARVEDDKIVETRTTYANDQIFYTLGFPVYKEIARRVVLPAKKQAIR